MGYSAKLIVFSGLVFWMLLFLAWASLNYESYVEYFHSYAGPKQLIDSLQVSNTEKEVKENMQRAGLKTRDLERVSKTEFRKSSLMIEVENYKTLGCTGVLLLQFYDEQLYDAWFYPDDLPSYVNRLKTDENIDLRSNDEVYKNGLKIWKFRDWHDKWYIGREDLAVKTQVESVAD